MKRLLLDQGVARSAGDTLRALGWDVVHVGEIGLAQAEDVDIIEAARSQQRVCVTRDSDFHALLALSGEKLPSVIRIRIESLTGEGVARVLLTVFERFEDQLSRGAFVTVTAGKIRLRPLPIRPRQAP